MECRVCPWLILFKFYCIDCECENVLIITFVIQ
jgi:hypothetical protein